METTKKCPYCGEEIKAVARKCRFCGNWLEDTSNSSQGQNIKINVSKPQPYAKLETKEDKQNFAKGFGYGCLAFIIFVIVLVIIAAS